MSTSNAKRLFRRGLSKSDILNIERQRELFGLLVGEPAAVVEAAEKELNRETRSARKFGIGLFNSELPLEQVIDNVATRFTDWEPKFATDIVTQLSIEHGTTMLRRPIETIAAAYDHLPTCDVCRLAKASEKYLNFESAAVVPMCRDCVNEMCKEAKNAKV